MLNFAIVGCGHIAKKHAQAIRQTKGAALVAVCDPVVHTMKEYDEKDGAVMYETMSTLLQDQKVEAVIICTPSGLHADLAIEAACASKHVIVEKPLALTTAASSRVIAACEKHGVKLAVVHPNRCRPGVQKLKEVLDHHDIGSVSHVNATLRWNRTQAYFDQAAWRGTAALDGGVLMNQAIHNIDLLLWLMGDVEEVYCMKETRVRNIEEEDVCVGTLRFRSGALGMIEAATTIYPENLEESISFFAERACIKLGGKQAVHIEHWKVHGMSPVESALLKAQIASDPFGKQGHCVIIEDFVQAVNEDRAPMVSGHEGQRALAVVEAMYRSAQQNRPIKVAPQGVFV
ncbi:Gfo/Idh/MocA family protein [Fictibacillus macauensis]|nr:Gfo/Idh/MocA family oxidoreductase [Fictibacillus macauensis]